MQRQRGELVPIGEAVAAFTGSALALGPPQRGFTVADQVHQLVGASEADPDRGFMARTMALCSLPRSNPGNRLQYKRVNGPYTLYMTVTGSNKLPYGTLPRLILAWVSTEAVRTQSPVLSLGKSLSEFMRALGVYDTGGRTQRRLQNQMKRLFGCTVQLTYENAQCEASATTLIAQRTVFGGTRADPISPHCGRARSN